MNGKQKVHLIWSIAAGAALVLGIVIGLQLAPGDPAEGRNSVSKVTRIGADSLADSDPSLGDAVYWTMPGMNKLKSCIRETTGRERARFRGAMFAMGPYEIEIADDSGEVYRGAGDWAPIEIAPGGFLVMIDNIKGNLETSGGLNYASASVTPKSVRMTIDGKACFEWEDTGPESWAGGKRK